MSNLKYVCGNCSTELTDSDKFCTGCGSELTPVNDVKAQSVRDFRIGRQSIPQFISSLQGQLSSYALQMGLSEQGVETGKVNSSLAKENINILIKKLKEAIK